MGDVRSLKEFAREAGRILGEQGTVDNGQDEDGAWA